MSRRPPAAAAAPAERLGHVLSAGLKTLSVDSDRGESSAQGQMSARERFEDELRATRIIREVHRRLSERNKRLRLGDGPSVWTYQAIFARSNDLNAALRRMQRDFGLSTQELAGYEKRATAAVEEEFAEKRRQEEEYQRKREEERKQRRKEREDKRKQGGKKKAVVVDDDDDEDEKKGGKRNPVVLDDDDDDEDEKEGGKKNPVVLDDDDDDADDADDEGEDENETTAET